MGVEDLGDVENWVHAEFDINLKGRCHKPPEKEEEEGGAEEEEEYPEPKEALRSISADTYTLKGGVDGSEEITKKEWQEPSEGKVRACPKGSTSPHFSVFVAKSMKWPGAIAAATKPNTITNVYVGFGVPSAPTSFPPRQPRNITMEWAPPEEEEDFAHQGKGIWTGGKALIEGEDTTVEPKAEDEEEE